MTIGQLGIIGGGAWGTALAQTLSADGQDVRLWAFETDVVDAINRLRSLELRKPPSISETLDWAQGLALLNADTLSTELVASTLNLVLKHESDIDKAKAALPTLIPE